MDLAIIGGGLSGSLLALALKKFHPRLQVSLFEKESSVCGNHTWCFHDQDIPDSLRPWLTSLISKSWTGYDVHFPQYSRKLSGTYHSIKSEDLARIVNQELSGSLQTGQELVSVSEKQKSADLADEKTTLKLKFKSGQEFTSQAVVMAQGWQTVLKPKQLGWQKFVGLELQLKKPHGLTRPILKDVREAQTDGYRFIYSLPFTDSSLLIEDTYYSNSPELSVEKIQQEILNYAGKQGWEIESILRSEKGCLPLFLDLPAKSPQVWPRIGAGSQFVNPVTGYTLPMTLQVIESLIQSPGFSLTEIKARIESIEKVFSKNLYYMTWLNRMMFLAAQPEKRFEILQRFYQLPEGLIGRFYAAKLTIPDRIRILSGKPPVPVTKALQALTKNLS